MQHEFCDPFPTPPSPNEAPKSLENCRRPRFESEIGGFLEEIGGGDTPCASEFDDDSQGEEGSFSPKQYGQSPSGAVYEAATAALDTNELLHLIIAEVPREYRTQLRRVSKAWKADVEKLGHVIEPLEDKEYKNFHKLSSQSVYHLPEKRFVCNKSNPLIRCQTEDTTFDCVDHDCPCDGYWGMQGNISFDPDGISGTPGGLEREEEFITDPPISQVHVAPLYPQRWCPRPVTLYVREGIRVRHLRECFENLKSIEYSSDRVVNFGVLHQDYGDSDIPNKICWWHLDDYSELGRGCVGGWCQEETGGGDTPYAGEANESSWDDRESREGGWANDEWSWEAEQEKWSYGSQRDGNELGGGETPRADYHGQGDYGEGSPASQEPDDRHEWSWEAEVEKWSKGSQGDASEAGGGETPYVNAVDSQGQGGDGEAGFTREELEGGHEWNFEAELEKWSKLD